MNVVALRSDGSVLSRNELDYDVYSSGQIVSIDATTDTTMGLGTDFHLIGVSCDGTLAGFGFSDDYSRSLPKIVSATQDLGGSIYGSFIACLDVNGNVHVSNREFKEVEDWNNIVQIEAGAGCLHAIDTEGRLVSYSKYDDYPQWTNLNKIDVAPDGALCGLTNDGIVLFTTDEGIEVDYEYPQNVVDIAYSSWDRGSARVLLTSNGQAHVTIFNGYNMPYTTVVDNVLVP